VSYSVSLTYRGLSIDAEIEDYDPGVHTFSNGDPGYPPEGGTCESFTWAVDDIDEVLESLEITSEAVENMIRACYKYTNALPPIIAKKIDDEWEEDIFDAATEHFWDHGGPGGQEDYHYDG
jgi:hypothetical protein